MKKSRLIFADSSEFRQRQRKKQAVLATGLGLCALIIGATWLGTKSGSLLGQLADKLPFQEQIGIKAGNKAESSAVLALVSLPASERAAQLQAIAQGQKSLDQSRARYLLAADLIQNKQGKKALDLLEGLEPDYPVMAPYIALKRSQIYAASGDKAKAQQGWRDILKRYPTSPVAAEALYVLGKSDPKLWNQAIAKFPSHPRTLEIVRSRLKQNPNQPQLMLLLVKYASDTPKITSMLDQLVNQSAAQLKPADWEAIASVYWQNQEYGKAGAAYLRAPDTPHNAYLVAKALELSSKKPEAITAYQYVVSQFPKAQETPTSLLAIGTLSEPAQGLPYLDRVISQYPDKAGEAVIEKAKIFDKMKNPKLAAEARQLLVSKYGSSEAAAEYRWTQAQARAAAGDLQGAWEWAQPITTQNANSQYGPRAAFWVGKWATKLGRQDDAKAAFEHALAQYPQSYYAWRSAVFLGWNVGDFTTVRQLTPQVVQAAERSLPSAGSDTLKELYQLGQDNDAWTLWQAEFQNQIQPTVAEQFTDGLMRLKVGKYQSGIDRVSKLEDRETPEEQAQFQALKQQMPYWHALYPFPYMDLIETWSQKRQINPLLVTGLIRQESRFEPKVRSVASAVGLMQIIPSTAEAEAKTNNLNKYDLTNPKDNIQLGTSYLDTTHRHYNNNSMLAVASYNAGPGNVSKWLKEKGAIEADEFVEAIPFEETKGYVKNVFGNYWNYLRLYNPEVSQQLAKYSNAQPTPVR
ncbi:MAG: transglycosylase SLT domain-containing protein [Aphanothece sp. CMT-3BRIN-NPC111]|jgi:soluble lytic murein transglycosylase|nr:transglycosylase SLT domain-containing protein [Aphanothece sp. CMT-3BRIN-NPC111]